MSPSSYGIAPIVAYTPTYSWILGVAGFVFPKTGRLGLDSKLVAVILPTTGQTSITFAREDEWNRHWGYSLEGNYNNFFTSYYGEGDHTSSTAQDFNQNFYRAHEGIVYHFSEIASLEGFVETRSRTDLGLDENGSMHLTPDETRSISGFIFAHDTRDSLVNSRSGHYALVQAHTAISGGNTGNFQQLEIEYRQFFALASRLTVGLRAEAATSNGTPSYNFEYNLGGVERLRGYLHNRFRGSQYYLGGSEIRRDVWRDYVQLAAFVDCGDIKDQVYLRPRCAYGGGVRIGLPPDWDMKFRIDFAAGDDQSGVFAVFGQAF